MGIRRTITFPEKELLDELERLQEHFDQLRQEVYRQEDEKWAAENRADEAEAERDALATRLAIAVEALDKIQNCNAEVVVAGDGELSIIYYDAPEARDLAILMASRALDEIGAV